MDETAIELGRTNTILMELGKVLVSIAHSLEVLCEQGKV
jgi:hypothetical protein